jgi:hypothetical protein
MQKSLHLQEAREKSGSIYRPLSGVLVHITGSYGEMGILFVPKTIGMHTIFYRSYIGCQY